MLALREAAGAAAGAGTFLRQACDHLARGVRGLVIALAGVMLVALTLQVVMRYVFNRAPSWTEELAVSCFSWSMLLAIALGVRDAIHVRMDLLIDRLPAPWRRALDRLACLAIAFIGCFLAWAGVNYVQSNVGTTSAAIGYPTVWLYACAPVCGALIAIFALERAFATDTPRSGN